MQILEVRRQLQTGLSKGLDRERPRTMAATRR